MIEILAKAITHELKQRLPHTVRNHKSAVNGFIINIKNPVFKAGIDVLVFLEDIKLCVYEFRNENSYSLGTYDLNDPKTSMETIALAIIKRFQLPTYQV